MMAACQDKEMTLHAYLDGELDSVNALAFEAHVRGCVGCSEALDAARDLRQQLSGLRHPEAAPAALAARIDGLVGNSRPTRPTTARPWFSGGLPWLGGGAIGALAASLAILLAAPQPSALTLADELVAGHVRSLEADHLVDVATSDRHTVKPWFNGKLDFAPPVYDLKAAGFPLVGGRLDYLGGRPAAALVYRRNLHTINLFIRPESESAAGAADTLRRQTYNLAHWSHGGLEFWAVSDVETAELAKFQQAFVEAAK